MASAFLASPSSRETTNFARLSRLLVDVAAQVLRKTFDNICPPAKLHTYLSSAPVHAALVLLRKKRVLNPTQWGKLFPSICSSVTSQHFDITLLMVLLKNICMLTPPPTGWDNVPMSTDSSMEADIVRIKYFRNLVYAHASQASIDDATFNNYWQDIREPLVRLGGADYGVAIDKLKTECMDPEMEAHYTELLKQWKRDEDSTKDKLEEIEEKINKLPTAISAALAQGFRKEEDVSPQAATASRYGVEKLVRSIKSDYLRRARLQPVPWCDTSLLSLERVYTRLTMKARKMQNPQLTSQEVDVYDIFCSHENCTDPRSVLVEGDPGIGKTTFCQKIAKDWASGVIPAKCSFPKVELVLLLKCRDVDGELRKEIEDQLLPLDVTDQDKCHFWEFLQDIQEKLLIILDGFDELKEHARHDVDKLLLRKILPKCFLVVTARQERGIHVRKHFDTVLEIKGFTEKDAFLYLRRHFQDKEKESLATALIEQVRKNSYLQELLKNPLNTVLLCLVFEDCKGTLPFTRTELYWRIMFCILKRFCTNEAVTFDDNTLIKKYEDVLVALGELALDGLKEDILCFSEKKLNTSTQQVPQMGFVSKEASTKVIKPEHYYSFPHKTLQEFFSALYLAHMVRTDVKDVYKFVSSISDIRGKFKQVLLFVAGILGKDGRRHFEMLGELITRNGNGNNHPLEFLIDSFKESGHMDIMAAALAPVMPLCPSVDFNGSVTLEFYSCSKYQPPYKENRENDFLVVGDIILPTGLIEFLSESSSLKSLCVAEDLHHQTGAVSTLLSKVLSESKSLTTLIFQTCQCDLNDVGLASLGKGLSENNSLKSLDLCFSFCGVRDCGPSSLGRGLSENKLLTSRDLTFSSGDVRDADLSCLGRGLSQNKSLTSLGLKFCHCYARNAGLSSLGRSLSRKKSLTSLGLNVSFCDLRDLDLFSLCTGLPENKSLTSLALKFSNCIVTDVCLFSLGKGLSENKSLTSLTLNFSKCDMRDADLSSVGRGLSEKMSLASASLNFVDCKFGADGLSSFGRGLSENK